MICIGVLFSISIIFADIAGEQFQLKDHFIEGKSYRFHQIYQEQITQILPEPSQSGEFVTTADLLYQYQVIKVDARSNALIKVLFESVKSTHDGPNGQTAFDSTDLLGKITYLQAPLAILASHSFEIGVHPNGTVKIVKGYQESIKSFMKTIDFSILPKGSEKFLKKYLDDSIGDKALKEMLQETIVPDHPIRLGETWKTTAVYTKGIPLIADSVFTLKEYNQGILTIEQVSALRSNIKAPPPVVFNNYAMIYEFTGEDRGRIQLSADNGLLIRSETTRELSGQFKAVKGPKDFKNKVWPFSLKASTTVEYLNEDTFNDETNLDIGDFN